MNPELLLADKSHWWRMKAHADRTRDHARKLWESEVLSRLQAAAGPRKFSALAAATDCHPETVRRYLRKGRPSAYFVARVCRGLGISPEWMLWGTGPMRSESPRSTVEPKPRRKPEGSAPPNSRSGSALLRDPAPL
jgi:hypothetical protein